MAKTQIKKEFWTAQKVSDLARLYAASYSHSRIAKEIGTTRSAVGHKLKRLGLAAMPTNVIEVSSPAAPSSSVRPAAVRAHATPLRRGAKGPAGEIFPPSRRPGRAKIKCVGITIMDLGDKSCRYPLGNPKLPSFRYCGAKKLEMGPYCKSHARLCYEPYKRRRVSRAPPTKALVNG